jgi:hypothetical protein
MWGGVGLYGRPPPKAWRPCSHIYTRLPQKDRPTMDKLAWVAASSMVGAIPCGRPAPFMLALEPVLALPTGL